MEDIKWLEKQIAQAEMQLMFVGKDCHNRNAIETTLTHLKRIKDSLEEHYKIIDDLHG